MENNGDNSSSVNRNRLQLSNEIENFRLPDLDILPYNGSDNVLQKNINRNEEIIPYNNDNRNEQILPGSTSPQEYLVNLTKGSKISDVKIGPTINLTVLDKNCNSLTRCIEETLKTNLSSSDKALDKDIYCQCGFKSCSKKLCLIVSISLIIFFAIGFLVFSKNDKYRDPEIITYPSNNPFISFTTESLPGKFTNHSSYASHSISTTTTKYSPDSTNYETTETSKKHEATETTKNQETTGVSVLPVKHNNSLFYTREEWGYDVAFPIKCDIKISKTDKIKIIASPMPCVLFNSCKEYLKYDMCPFDVDSFCNYGILYHFAISRIGEIYEARPITCETAPEFRNCNQTYMLVQLFCGYCTDKYVQAQIKSFNQIVLYIQESGILESKALTVHIFKNCSNKYVMELTKLYNIVYYEDMSEPTCDNDHNKEFT